MSDRVPLSRGCSRLAMLRRGFTLIEILVVVAIIALLTAILLPSLARARFQAKLVVCKANLHDLGIGFFQYAEAYKGYYPVTPNSIYDTYYSLWKARLLKNVQTLICPSTRNVIRPETLNYPIVYDTNFWLDPEVKFPSSIPHLEKNGRVSDLDQVAPMGRDDSSGGHSYEYNGCYTGIANTADPAWSPWQGKHKRATHFRFVLSQIFLVNDADDDWMGSSLGCENAISGGNNCPQTWDNHGAEGMNMMFADGHAEWVRKVGGSFPDRRNGSLVMTKSKNASIDYIETRSTYPWLYFQH